MKIKTQFFLLQNDIPLGVFLDSFCFDESYKCPSKKECSIPMRDHVRRFCLGDACVTLVLQVLTFVYMQSFYMSDHVFFIS